MYALHANQWKAYKKTSLAHNAIQMHSADRTERSSTVVPAKQPGNTEERERER